MEEAAEKGQGVLGNTMELAGGEGTLEQLRVRWYEGWVQRPQGSWRRPLTLGAWVSCIHLNPVSLQPCEH